MTPYSLDSAAKKTTAGRLLSESDKIYDEEATEDEEESSQLADISHDAMIKVSQGKGKGKPGQSTSSKQRKKTANTQIKKSKSSTKRKQ